MIHRMRHFILEIVGALFIGVLVLFFFQNNSLSLPSWDIAWSSEWLTVKTLFLSILLEAIPFVLLGVFFSALIQTFVKDEHIRKWMPKSPMIAIPFATVLGFLFPVCECAIIPIIRRLIQKGMPVYVGMVFLLAGPIVNPVVLSSTYIAFQRNPEMVWYRGGMAIAVASVIGLFVYLFVKQSPLKIGADRELRHEVQHYEARSGGIGTTFHHAVDEFFDMGKYLIFGALLSALVQAFVARDALVSIGQTPLQAHVSMMGLAYLLSLCSEADAFIAASFANSFSLSSLLAFLVFGPMIDLKNTLLLFSVFKAGFVVRIIALITVLVLIITLTVPV